jgi:hypothetical protein
MVSAELAVGAAMAVARRDRMIKYDFILKELRDYELLDILDC